MMIHIFKTICVTTTGIEVHVNEAPLQRFPYCTTFNCIVAETTTQSSDMVDIRLGVTNLPLLLTADVPTLAWNLQMTVVPPFTWVLRLLLVVWLQQNNRTRCHACFLSVRYASNGNVLLRTL